MTGAELTVRFLAAAGVRYAFGVSSTTTLDILDALHAQGEVTYLSARHEHGAAAMADGYARATGSLAACLVQGGPGACNVVCGVASAFKDSVPLLVIAGEEESWRLPRDGRHIVDLLSLFRPITKWAVRAPTAGELPRSLRQALTATVSGRPGPVFVGIPKDVQQAAVEGNDPGPGPLTLPLHRPSPSRKEVEAAVALLLEARAPVVLAGGGAVSSGAGEALRGLVERLRLPVLTTGMGRGILPEDHPCALGPVGQMGSETASGALASADLILALGARFSDTATLNWTLIPQGARIIQVEIDPARLGVPYPAALAMSGDILAFLEALQTEMDHRGARPGLGWENRTGELKRAWEKEQAALFADVPRGGRVRPDQLVKALMEGLDPDALLCVGAGQHTSFFSKLPVKGPRRYLHSTGLASMGFAFPAALGAKLAFPRRQVVALVGDGDFAMTLGELETACRCGLGVGVVVFNNMGFLGIKDHQRQRYGGRYIGVDLTNPDFAALAASFGAEGRRVSREAELEGALKEVGLGQKPTVVEILLDGEECSALMERFARSHLAFHRAAQARRA
ncbi:MAG: thiamine pyrophosphate-binding protein [Deltaproteobacteria bacterium]|nr:thiamine pyrophosphate-binding protein [Deltaproteobacteria bacterium]